MTGDKAAYLRGATYAFDYEDNLDGQSDKQGNTRTDRAASMGDLLIRKNLRWSGHFMMMLQATKAGSLLSTVFWSQKERALWSTQGYHQEKPEAERHKDRTSLQSREIHGEQ